MCLPHVDMAAAHGSTVRHAAAPPAALWLPPGAACLKLLM